MLTNYLTIAFRTFRREKGYAAINIAGLAVGLACALLILTYIRFEQSYDTFHAHADRLYRVENQQPGNVFMGTDRFAVTPAPLGRVLREAVEGVEEATTFSQSVALLRRGEVRIMEEGLWADAHFFRLFSFPLLRGEAETVLERPNTVVLTASLAQRLFGSTDPVGQPIEFVDQGTFIVTGVAADPPAASHLQFSYAVSIVSSGFFRENQDVWNNQSWQTYVRAAPNADPDALGARLTALYRLHEGQNARMSRAYLQPLAGIHLHSEANFGLGDGGDARTLYLFGAIAIIILLLACVNYTNLATARAARRAREVGVRKAVGAARSQLTLQHLSESVLTAMLALLVGAGLAAALLPTFGAWVDRDLSFSALGPYAALVPLLGLAVGLLAGVYPAFALTALRAAPALRGQGALGAPRSRLRAVLVVGQYAAAVVLVIGGLVVYQQLQFIRSQTPGFAGEQIVTLNILDAVPQEALGAFKDELLRLPGVSGVTASTDLPINVGSSTRLQVWEGHAEGPGNDLSVYQMGADHTFFDVFGMEMAAGRAFSPAFPSDTSGALILNETAARHLGWSAEEAVGKTIQFWEEDRPVVGVVRDFHLHSLHRPIEPLLIRYTARWVGNVAVRVQARELPHTLAQLQETWQRFSTYPFDYAFLDDAFATLYEEDRRLGEGFAGFMMVALFIASLGLLGLAAFAAEQRRKEIGVRKVLGRLRPRHRRVALKRFSQAGRAGARGGLSSGVRGHPPVASGFRLPHHARPGALPARGRTGDSGRAADGELSVHPRGTGGSRSIAPRGIDRAR